MNTENLKIEKRKFARLNGGFSAVIKTDSLSERKVICENISQGGVFLRIPFSKFEHPEISFTCLKYEKIYIRVKLEDNNSTIEAIGMTKWGKNLNSLEHNIDKEYGVGVEFTDILPEQKNRLTSYINKKVKFPLNKFVYIIKPYLADVNVFGTTYFSRYFDWQGKTREEFFLLIPGHQEVIASGIVLVTKNASIEYLDSVRLFEEVEIEFTSANIKRFSFEIIFRYFTKRLIDNEEKKVLLAVGREKICFVKTSGITGKQEIVPVPENIKNSLLLILDQSGK